MSKEMTAVGFKDFFSKPDRKEGILANLPQSVNRDVFMNSVYALALDTTYQNADIKQIFKCVHEAARDGLVLDKREATIVSFRGKMTYIPMIGGVVKRILNSGQVSEISAQTVHENDEFDLYETEDGRKMFFRQCLRGDRGAVIGAFCRMKFINGGCHIEYMTVEEINKRRPASAGAGTPWGQWYGEMAKKTVIKKASKMCPMSSEIYAILEKSVLQENKPMQDITTTAKEPEALEVDNNTPLTEEAPRLSEESSLFEDIHTEQPRSKALMTILNKQEEK